MPATHTGGVLFVGKIANYIMIHAQFLATKMTQSKQEELNVNLVSWSLKSRVIPIRLSYEEIGNWISSTRW